MGFSWKSLSPFGVEVDADLSRPLDGDDLEEFLDVFSKEHLIVAPGQSLSLEAQRRLTGHFGPVQEHDVDIVSTDPTVGMFGSNRLAFHSDLAFLPEPNIAISLYALDLTPGTSSTLFASGARAYENLPTTLQERLEGLEVYNVFPNDQSRRNRLAELEYLDLATAHPLVMRDERSGRPYIYLTEMFADNIVGLDADESEELLQTLFSAMFTPENVLVHTWDLGDCVLWDNRAVQHGRDDVGTVGTRTLQRGTAANAGFFEQCPQFTFGEDGLLKRLTSA
jgi:taurine dioxygenase